MKTAKWALSVILTKVAFHRMVTWVRNRAQPIARAIHRIIGLGQEEEHELSLIESGLRKKVLAAPGISHTQLTRSLGGSHDSKEAALERLLGKGDLRCEQKGRVRRYYPAQ